MISESFPSVISACLLMIQTADYEQITHLVTPPGPTAPTTVPLQTRSHVPGPPHRLSSLWKGGHCTPSRLQSFIGDSAVLPWPQAPDPSCNHTKDPRQTNYHSWRRRKGYHCYSHSLIVSVHSTLVIFPLLHCPGKTSSLIWAASTPNWLPASSPIPTLHEPSVSHISPRLNSTLNMD